MSPSYRLLHVEDSPEDAELLRFALENARGSFTITRVETEADYTAQLEACAPDVVLCDYQLPQFQRGACAPDHSREPREPAVHHRLPPRE